MLTSKRSALDGLCILIVVWTTAIMVGREISYAWARGNNLSEIADPYGEADVLKSAESYATLGFGAHVGLPDVSYGTNFDHQGGKYDLNLCAHPVDCIYLHNPPGNPLTIGVLVKIFGVNRLFVYRLFYLLIGTLGFAYLGWALVRTQGAKRAAAVFVLFYNVPASYDMMHGLCYHGTLLALLLAEVGMLLFIFERDRPMSRAQAAGLTVVGALSSCFSYEYIFLTTLCAIPIWLMQANFRSKPQLRKVITCSGILMAVFATIQILHIIQVAVYLGGLGAALRDLATRGAMRAGYGTIKDMYPLPGILGVYGYYWFDQVTRKLHLDLNFVAFIGTVVGALLMRRPMPFTVFGHNFVWHSEKRYLAAFAASFVIATSWITVMQAHAAVHGHFLPRQYLFPLFFGVLLIARSFRRAEAVATVAPAAATA